MPTQLSLADLDVVHPLAERYARRLCRTLGRPSHEREDMEQDMLLDLLARLAGFDPARGTLAAFATVCFQHRASRLATRLRREKRERHEASLDDAVPGQEEELTLADIIPESEGMRRGAVSRPTRWSRWSAASTWIAPAPSWTSATTASAQP